MIVKVQAMVKENVQRCTKGLLLAISYAKSTEYFHSNMTAPPWEKAKQTETRILKYSMLDCVSGECFGMVMISE